MELKLKNRLFPFHQEKGSNILEDGGRLIVIGDVHGCIRELEKLLKKIDPKKNDRVLFLGDLVNRGPNSKEVIRLARDIKATSLVGNHEYRLLKFYHDPDSIDLKPYERSTLSSLDAKDWTYLATMVLWLEIPPRKLVFVHAGFLPHIPWRKQSASIVTQIQVIDKAGLPRKRSEAVSGKPWADLWKQKPFVVYGHTPRAKVYKKRYSLGLDTGCVWGGKLSALILPENKIVQVNAKKKYVK